MLEIMQSLPHQSDVYNSRKWLSDPNHYPVYGKVWSVLRPKTIYEIGTFLGYSLVAALLACGDEIEQLTWTDDESGLHDSNRLAMENIRHVSKTVSCRFARNYIQKVNCDVVHVDGDHSYQAALQDFVFVENQVNTRYVIGHDLRLPGSGVEKALKEVWPNHKLIEVLGCTNGMFVIDLIGNGDDIITRLREAGVNCTH